MKNAPGYTTVELMITLGVVGLLAMAALPSLREFVARERLVTRSNELIGALNTARVRAVVARMQTIVCPSADGTDCRADGDWSAGFIAFDDADGDRVRDVDETLFRVGRDEAGALAVRSSRPLVAFRPSGRADGTNLSIRICNGASSAIAPGGAPGRLLSVNNAGRTRQSKVSDCPR